jgi:hypothetical protein
LVISFGVIWMFGMKDNKWLRLLAYVTGQVNQELLLQNEYLAAENRILRAHLPARLRLSDAERSALAEIGKRLGRKALAQIACVAKPDTILACYRRLTAGQIRRFPLGADRGRVIGLVMREAGFLLTIGLIAGTGLAPWTARAASTLLFGLKPYDPATLVTACAVLAGVGMVASYAPARSASHLDPMHALREEQGF